MHADDNPHRDHDQDKYDVHHGPSPRRRSSGTRRADHRTPRIPGTTSDPSARPDRPLVLTAVTERHSIGTIQTRIVPDHDRTPCGRPLDPGRDAALRQAALELVAELGYDRTTIEAVASRAGAGKATVYRRWSSKADLVMDAFVSETFGGDTPDTGSLRGDLVAMAQRLWGEEAPVPRARVMAGMVSAMLRHPELRNAMASIARPPQALIEEMIRRAVERGEISKQVDTELVGSVIPGICIYRLVMTGKPPTTAFVESVVDQVLLPAMTACAPSQPKTGRV